MGNDVLCITGNANHEYRQKSFRAILFIKFIITNNHLI